jgi:hypothetical protein
MYSGSLVFAQVMEFLPLKSFWRCVAAYPEQRPFRKFSHLDHFLCMAFAQLTGRDSLRDIESCLNAISTKVYHLGMWNPEILAAENPEILAGVAYPAHRASERPGWQGGPFN